jgi:hypothetical protein
LGKGIFVHHRIVSAVKRVEFVRDMTTYIDLRGRWRNIIVLNVNAPSEEKSDDSKDSFMSNWSRFFYLFPKHRMKILLGALRQKWGERIFSNPQLGMEPTSG